MVYIIHTMVLSIYCVLYIELFIKKRMSAVQHNVFFHPISKVSLGVFVVC